jgi:hypothetical protein
VGPKEEVVDLTQEKPQEQKDEGDGAGMNN